MNKQSRRGFGDEAECRAADYLISRGYKILQRGYHYGHKEIDIICQKENTIVFVEVKASRTNKFGQPEYRVTEGKRRNLTIAAQGYIAENMLTDVDFRFDVICYIRMGGDVRLNHLPGAFCAEENP